MTIAETATEWASREPQRSFITCAEQLQNQGHSIDDLSEAMIALALTMQNKVHGPRAMAGRLLALADKFAGEANRLEREARDATAH